jgi:hypothetical protein
VPSGLRLGRLRAWGYPLHGEVERGAERRLAEGDDGAEFLPIGLFVEPAVRAAELVRVLLWRERAGGAGTAPEAGALVGPSPFAGGSLESVRVLRIAVPQPLGERWLAWSTAFELAVAARRRRSERRSSTACASSERSRAADRATP